MNNYIANSYLLSDTTRDLRQKDPLSPFLFTIVAVVLSRMVTAVEKSGLIEGFIVGKGLQSLLLIANDMIFGS